MIRCREISAESTMAVQVDQARNNDGAGSDVAHRILISIGEGVEVIAVAGKTNTVAVHGEHAIGDLETIGDEGSVKGVARRSHDPSLEERTRPVTGWGQ